MDWRGQRCALQAARSHSYTRPPRTSRRRAAPSLQDRQDEGLPARARSPVRPDRVVVADVLGEDDFEMSPGDDEKVAEAVPRHGADEPLGERVQGEATGARGSSRCRRRRALS